MIKAGFDRRMPNGAEKAATGSGPPSDALATLPC